MTTETTNSVNTNSTVAPVAIVKASKVKTGKLSVKRGRGRPEAELKLILTKTFSLADLFALNPDKHQLTVRRHIKNGLKSGQFTQLEKKATTGKRGKPAFLFINTKVLLANRANLAKVKAHVQPVVAEAVTA